MGSPNNVDSKYHPHFSRPPQAILLAFSHRSDKFHIVARNARNKRTKAGNTRNTPAIHQQNPTLLHKFVPLFFFLMPVRERVCVCVCAAE